ncbi:MAG: M56 family metallopeptidase [Bacteroidota bacterium]
MSSALDVLVGLGGWAIPAVWLPVLAWTLAALAVDAVLRLRPGHPLVGLGVRRAMLWALPAGIVAAVALPALLPETAIEQVAAFRPPALDTLVLPTILVEAETGTVASASVPLGSVVAGVVLLLAGGMALVRLGSVASGWAALRHLSAGVAPEAVQRETEAAARAAGVAREVRAVTTEAPTVPFTFGWRRPVVVVPAALSDDPEALRLVLAHEVAHVARGDFAAGVAERVLTALFGWHPLVGALARRVDLDRERATDAAVLAGHPERRRDYASLLLSFSRLPSPALALGAVSGSDSLTTRITDMNRSPLSPNRLRSLRRLARAMGAGVFLLAIGATAILAVGPHQARDLLAAEAASTLAAKPPPAIATEAGVTDPAETASVPEADTPPVAPADTLDDDTIGDALIALAAAMAEAESETVVIEGRIVDAMSGRPLAGASVLALGTRLGAATDRDGRFTLTGVDADGEVQLRITFIGYEPLTVVPQVGERLRIGLVPENASEQRTTAEQAVARARERRAERSALESPEAPEVFVVVEEPPVLIGGQEGLAARLSYPASAREAGIEGTVYVQFIVEENGRVARADCTGDADDTLCGAATTAVRDSEFTPGRQRGKVVKVQMVLPVRFQLPDDTDE